MFQSAVVRVAGRVVCGVVLRLFLERSTDEARKALSMTMRIVSPILSPVRPRTRGAARQCLANVCIERKCNSVDVLLGRTDGDGLRMTEWSWTVRIYSHHSVVEAAAGIISGHPFRGCGPCLNPGLDICSVVPVGNGSLSTRQ